MKLPITLQINLAPNVYPVAKFLLLEQIELFNDSVDEILLTVETKKSDGRFGAKWKQHTTLLTAFLSKIRNRVFPQAQLGFYDIVDELHNGEDVRKQLKANRCFKQFFKL